MDSFSLSSIKNETTRQVTSFNYEKRSKTIPVPRGQRATLGEGTGPGVLTQLWLTFPGWFWQHWNPTFPVNPTILKTLILRIYWDGEKTPAVQAPVGDFFGNGLCEVTSFAGRYFGMSSGGFFCKFPMPFRKSFRIEAENLDQTIDTDIFLNAVYQVVEEVGPSEGYFHTAFATGRGLQEGMTLVELEGKGHYAGCSLSLEGERLNELSFLEAPEYVYVDEDWTTPRITGTGLEDYFLGGWYFREGTFTGPLHGVPVKDTLRASVVMYRVHEADVLRFQKRFRFTFVHPWEKERINPFFFSSASFLYLDKPAGLKQPDLTREGLLLQYRMRDMDHQSIP